VRALRSTGSPRAAVRSDRPASSVASHRRGFAQGSDAGFCDPGAVTAHAASFPLVQTSSGRPGFTRTNPHRSLPPQGHGPQSKPAAWRPSTQHKGNGGVPGGPAGAVRAPPRSRDARHADGHGMGPPRLGPCPVPPLTFVDGRRIVGASTPRSPRRGRRAGGSQGLCRVARCRRGATGPQAIPPRQESECVPSAESQEERP